MSQKKKKGLFNKLAKKTGDAGKWVGKNMPFTAITAGASAAIPGSQIITVPFGAAVDGLRYLHRAGKEKREGKVDPKGKDKGKENPYLPKK